MLKGARVENGWMYGWMDHEKTDDSMKTIEQQQSSDNNIFHGLDSDCAITLAAAPHPVVCLCLRLKACSF